MCLSPLVALTPLGEHILLASVQLVECGIGWQVVVLPLFFFDQSLPGGLRHQILWAASSVPALRGCLEEGYESADLPKASLAGRQHQACLTSTGPLKQYLGRGVRATSGVWK